MITKFLRFEINRIKTDNFILEAEQGRNSIRVKAYKYNNISKTYLMIGIVLNIFTDQSGFKTTKEFKMLDNKLKEKLLNLACQFCNLKTIIGGEDDDSINLQNINGDDFNSSVSI